MTSGPPPRLVEEARRRRNQWARYLLPEVTPAHGTYQDRRQEYREAAAELLRLGLRDGDLLLDVGAGTCDLDRYLRTEVGWNGRYVPIDGNVDGTDLAAWHPGLMDYDFVVSTETVEHVSDPLRLVYALLDAARYGLVITTPNADVQDVRESDPTHYDGLGPAAFEERGFDVRLIDFNGRGTPLGADTIIATKQVGQR